MAGRAGNAIHIRVVVTALAVPTGPGCAVWIGMAIQRGIFVAGRTGHPIQIGLAMAGAAVRCFPVRAVGIGMPIQAGVLMAKSATRAG